MRREPTSMRGGDDRGYLVFCCGQEAHVVRVDIVPREDLPNVLGLLIAVTLQEDAALAAQGAHTPGVADAHGVRSKGSHLPQAALKTVP
jgi:hypothetical protein